MSTHFDLRQQWRCVIEYVGIMQFVAKATYITPPGKTETMTIDKSDVAEDDRKLIVVGATFFLNEDYRISEWGTKTKGSEIHFFTQDNGV